MDFITGNIRVTTTSVVNWIDGVFLRKKCVLNENHEREGGVTIFVEQKSRVMEYKHISNACKIHLPGS